MSFDVNADIQQAREDAKRLKKRKGKHADKLKLKKHRKKDLIIMWLNDLATRTKDIDDKRMLIDVIDFLKDKPSK